MSSSLNNYLQISVLRNSGATNEKDELYNACFFISFQQFLETIGIFYSIRELMGMAQFTNYNNEVDTIQDAICIERLVETIQRLHNIRIRLTMHRKVPGMDGVIANPDMNDHTSISFGSNQPTHFVDIYETNYNHFELITRIGETQLVNTNNVKNTWFKDYNMRPQVPSRITSSVRPYRLKYITSIREQQLIEESRMRSHGKNPNVLSQEEIDVSKAISASLVKEKTSNSTVLTKKLNDLDTHLELGNSEIAVLDKNKEDIIAISKTMNEMDRLRFTSMQLPEIERNIKKVKDNQTKIIEEIQRIQREITRLKYLKYKNKYALLKKEHI